MSLKGAIVTGLTGKQEIKIIYFILLANNSYYTLKPITLINTLYYNVDCTTLCAIKQNDELEETVRPDSSWQVVVRAVCISGNCCDDAIEVRKHLAPALAM